MRVVVYRTGHLGDTVCAIPAFRCVRKYFPSDYLTLLCDAPSDGKVASHEVAKRLGVFNNIVTYRSGRGWRTIFDLYKSILKIKPDVVVALPQVNRSQGDLARHALFFKLAGVRKVYGFRSLDFGRDWRPNEPMRLLKLLDSEGIRANSPSYEIPVDEKIFITLIRQFQEVGIYLTSPYVVFCGGGKTLTQRWPLDRYAGMLQKICAEFMLPIIGLGSPVELDMYREVIKPVFPHLILPKQSLSIGELIEITRHAICYIGNDTGPMHLSAALGVPVIAVVSARNKPGQWDPDIDMSLILRNRTSCEGCWTDACPFGHHDCMMSMDVNMVSSRAIEFLRQIISK